MIPDREEKMTRIIYYVSFNAPTPSPGTYGSAVPCSTLVWDDVLPASSIVSAINVGAYRFPLMPQPGPVFAVQHGDLVLATRPPSSPRPDVHITRREREVLCMLAEGRSLQQIGYLLHIKPRTVTGHITHLKERLGAGSREQLVARAIALGLYRPSLPD
jgi:DNA-binding CsgD family transcriptional regulator